MTAFRDVKIDWRLKAAAFRLFDTLPFGDHLYFATQRHVTKTVPRKLAPTSRSGYWQLQHARAFGQYFGDFTNASFYEFGAGWDLYSNLLLYCMGMNRQTVVDVRRWARSAIINQVIRHLQIDPPEGAVRVPERLLDEDRFELDLEEHYGIVYFAPGDARKLPIADNSVDLIATTSTLEHIPVATVVNILKECRRVAHPNATISHVIDYSDHYAHSDSRITPYNFLRFSDRTWRRYNPGVHFQNRLRHADFVRLFGEAGFKIVHESTFQPEEAESFLQQFSLDDCFATYSRDDLKPVLGHFVLKKAQD